MKCTYYVPYVLHLVNISISRYTYTYLSKLANAHPGVDLAHVSAVSAHVTATEEDGRNYFGVCIDSGLAIESVAGAKGRTSLFGVLRRLTRVRGCRCANYFSSLHLFLLLCHT